jgi:hypothetical protein
MKQRRSNRKHIGGQISSILFIPLDRARAETTLAGMDVAQPMEDSEKSAPPDGW